METRLLCAVNFMWFPHFSWQPFPGRRSSHKFLLEWWLSKMASAVSWHVLSTLLHALQKVGSVLWQPVGQFALKAFVKVNKDVKNVIEESATVTLLKKEFPFLCLFTFRKNHTIINMHLLTRFLEGSHWAVCMKRTGRVPALKEFAIKWQRGDINTRPSQATVWEESAEHKQRWMKDWDGQWGLHGYGEIFRKRYIWRHEKSALK